MSVYLELSTLSDDTKLANDVKLNTDDVTKKVSIVDEEYNAYNDSDEEPDVADLVGPKPINTCLFQLDAKNFFIRLICKNIIIKVLI